MAKQSGMMAYAEKYATRKVEAALLGFTMGVAAYIWRHA